MKMLFSLLFVLSVAGTAQAAKHTVGFKIQSVQNYSAYQLVENKGSEVVLELVDKKHTSVSELQGAAPKTSTSTDLPRKEKGEFNNLTIKKITDKKVLLLRDALLIVDSEFGQFKIVNKSETEAEFTRGAWDDLQKNLDVEFTLTKKGKAALEKQALEFMKKILTLELMPALQKDVGLAVQLQPGLSYKLTTTPKFSGTLQRITSDSTDLLQGKFSFRL